jgi:hypothetical protein
MLVGHVAAALLVKQVKPRLSLGAALLASLLADLILFALVLADVEQVEFRTARTAAAPFRPLSVALSHSLVMTAVWGGALAVVYRGLMGRGSAAWSLAAVAISHWILDVIAQPVLPLGPTTPVYVGSVLSRWIAVVMVVEAAIWVGALILYVRDSRSVNSAGRYVFWGGVMAWTYVWWANQAGAPRNAEEAPIEMIVILVMMVGWGYWMERARVMKEEGA